MKHLPPILVAALLSPPLMLHAQNESEPNNDFGQANTITLGSAMNGDLGTAPCASGTSDDYFALNLANDGQLTIQTLAQNSSTGSVTLRVLAYNSNGGQIAYFDHATGAAGSPGSVSSTMYCMAKGLYYFRLQPLSGSVCYTYALTLTQTAPLFADDLEPNNDFGQAAANPPLVHNAFKQGHLNFSYYGDNDDYYYIPSTPVEGTMNVTLMAENAAGSPGSIRVYLYNSGGGQVDYFDAPSGASGDDETTTASFPCYGLGAYYIRLVATGGCGHSYKLKYNVTGAVYANDAEPNSDFATAAANPLLDANTFTEGHINFNHYGDNDDYYYLLTNGEGTVRITTIAERVPAVDGTLRIFVYNNGGGQVNYYDATAGGSSDDDTTTFEFDCYGQGNYYLRVQSINGCGISYKLKYQLLPAVYGNDTEPNSDFATAAANPLLAANSFTEGHINFNHYGDNDDYFYLLTNGEGTVRITTIAERVPAADGTLRIFVYNNGGGQVNYYDATAGGSSDDDTTTFEFDCYGQGNYYLRVQSINGCGISYKLKYQLLPAVYGSDTEPNNDFTTAAANPLLPDNSFTEGHINFNHYGDNDDYYYIQTPASGVLRLTTIAERVPSAPGALRIYVYNNGGGQVDYYDATAGGSNDDDTTSADFLCYGQGNYYLRVHSINGCGISYKLKYQTLPAIFGNDPEPNSDFTTAALLNPDSAMADGQLNFSHYGDNDDYYRLSLPAPGSITFTLLAENSAGGTIRLYLYNNGGSQLSYQDVPVGAGHVPLSTLVGFGSLAAGNYYIRLRSIAGCGISYRLNCHDADGDGTCNFFDLCPAGPEPGTPCDDGNPNTAGDVIDANCDCQGSSTWDCPVLQANIGDACDDGNANTGNDLVDASCTCTGEAIDCLGNPGGGALPGTPCDDGDACTTGDNYDANCNCVGTYQDADNDGTCDAQDLCPAGPEPGTACNDDNPATFGDMIQADCSCAGTFSCTPGTPCDDGNPETGNDVFNVNCDCVGQPYDCQGVPGGSALPGTACDDGIACTVGDTYDANCGCTGTFADDDNDGTCDADDLCNGGPEPGSPCDDGDANTTGDLVQGDCSCSGTPVNPCTDQQIVLHFTLDGSGSQTTWELLSANGSTTLASGGPYTDGTPGTTITESICVPTGCYRLNVHDANGDGMGDGGYTVTDGLGQRLIDANGDFGALSSTGSKFCLPIGPVEVLPEYCDITDVTEQDSLLATSVEGATAYQFWFFDPHSSYKKIYTRSTPQIGPQQVQDFPTDLDLNVRIRAVVDGDLLPYGPACRIATIKLEGMARRPAAAMAQLRLQAWPNPNQGSLLNLSLTGLDPEAHTAEVTLTDALGRQVLATRLPAAHGQVSGTVDLGNTRSGVYLLRVVANGAATESRIHVVKE
jgi:hypothetical protein